MIAPFVIHHGECLDVLRTMPDNSIDSIVTDPPYGLSFMGKKWDYDVPAVEVWAECLRVLKPGGHLLAFAGTRTQHRMACRIEDAGFEIRDMIAWLYGSGFPKSLDVSKALDKAARVERAIVGYDPAAAKRTSAISTNAFGDYKGQSGDVTAPATEAARQREGWGTALKPAMEPITVARKPLIGTVAANILAHGTGALNIDGCRVPTDENLNGGAYAESGGRATSGSLSASGMNLPGKTVGTEFLQPSGRWPANTIHDGSEEVLAAFPQTASGDKGSAARFFYCASLFPKVCCDPLEQEIESWRDQNQTQSSVGAAELNFCLQKEVGATVQNAVATWPSLAGIVSSGWTELFTSATRRECEAVCATCIATIAVIGSECSQESQHEKRIPSGSLAKAAAVREQTGTTTITASLWRSDGFVVNATFVITPTSLDRGEAVCRFKYCAKSSKADRNEGCDALQPNNHPTVKPTDLMRYLCRLVTPPGGTVLDPFFGSGSTGKAAILEGFSVVGIERDAESVAIAQARCEHAVAEYLAAKTQADESSRQEVLL